MPQFKETFKENLITQVKSAVRPREGACGICHAVAEEICRAGGRIVAYERPGGILARIFDDQGNVIGEGFGVVWSPAVLAAEIDAGLIPDEVAEDLKKEGINKMRTMVASDARLPLLFFRGEGMMAGPYIQLEKDLD